MFAFLSYFMFGYFFKGNNLNEEINKLDYRWALFFLLCSILLFIIKDKTIS